MSSNAASAMQHKKCLTAIKKEHLWGLEPLTSSLRPRELATRATQGRCKNDTRSGV